MGSIHRGFRALCLPVLLWSNTGNRSYGFRTRLSAGPIHRFSVAPGWVQRPCCEPWRLLHSPNGDDVQAQAESLPSQTRSHLAFLTLAEKALTQWARTGRSRQRLRPLVDLALSSLPVVPTGSINSTSSNGTTTSTNTNTTETNTTNTSSIADIGTDHGLLAVALAVTGQFRVVGVDLSEAALHSGAFALLDEITLYQQQQHSFTTDERLVSHSLEFRHGNALHALVIGEADTVCIAGMGVYTMMEILSATDTGSNTTVSSLKSTANTTTCTTASFSSQPESLEQPLLLLDKLNCRRLILQPTHSRPRLMTYLYDNLISIGWTVRDERIEYLSSRWYLSVVLERTTPTASVSILPGTLLMQSTDTQTQHDLQRWIAHHANWIRTDAAQTGTWYDEDLRWMTHFRSFIAP